MIITLVSHSIQNLAVFVYFNFETHEYSNLLTIIIIIDICVLPYSNSTFCKLFLWNKTYRQFFVVNIKWDFIFRIGNSRTQIVDQKII